MNEILVFGVTFLALIGAGVLSLLRKIHSLLEEIRENMPDRCFRTDEDDESATTKSFWEEAELTMNRIARIYEKFVLGEDYLAERQRRLEKWKQPRSSTITADPNDENSR